MRISDWSSDVCSSDLADQGYQNELQAAQDRFVTRTMIPEGERAVQNEAQRNCQQIASEIGELRVPIGPGREHPIGQGLKRRDSQRSEEHTSELQSLMRISYAVFCLKKKRKTLKHTQ